MATQLQLRRGTTSENGSFTGALGEVTVDTDKDTLVVHDGATAGGHELAKTSDLTAKAAIDGSNMTAIDVGDNVQLKMGSSDDLKIYHDGTNSYIDDAGTGNLIINGTEVRILSDDTSEYAGRFISNGAVELYYDSDKKIATTSGGVDVTGDVAVSGNITKTGDLTLDSSGKINLDHGSPEILLKDDGTHYASFINSNTDFVIQSIVSDKDMLFKGNDGGSAITALTLDMSAAGAATFNGNVSVPNGSLSSTGSLGTWSVNMDNAQMSMTRGGTNYITAGTASGNFALQTTTSGSSTATALTLDANQNVSVPNGDLLVGTTAANTSADGIWLDGSNSRMFATATSNYTAQFKRFGTDGVLIYFDKAGASVGNISVTGSATAYNTSSDYRLKEDWQPLSGATDRLKELKPVNFAWKADGSRVDGFLAHEAQEVVPESVTGTKDGMMTEEYEVSPATGDIYTPAVEAVEGVEAVEYVAPQDEVLDEEGNVVTEAVEEIMAVEAVEAVEGVAEVIHSANVERPSELEDGQEWRETTAQVMGEREVPDYQGIDQSKLVPLLVATIQELEARITALEA